MPRMYGVALVLATCLQLPLATGHAGGKSAFVAHRLPGPLAAQPKRCATSLAPAATPPCRRMASAARRGFAPATELSRIDQASALCLRMQSSTASDSETSGGSSGEQAEESGLTRKERRRMNRKSRNNKRNRLDAPGGASGSIRRSEALSQHFLTDESTISRLVEQVQDSSPSGKCVVELGPGLGAITAPLMELYPKMTAIELDGLAVGELKQRFPALDVREMSLLDFDFAAHAQAQGGRLTVIANVPFGISSQTLYKLLDNSEHIARAVLVLQQEVVNRVLADPSQRKYSTLSVEHILRCARVEEIMKVPSIAFSPPPRRTLTAAVVMDYAPEAPVDEEEALILRAAMTTAFGEGNKPKPVGETLWKSSVLRRTVPGLEDICRSDLNWLRKKPSELAPGKWLHVARSLSSFAVTEREAMAEDED